MYLCWDFAFAVEENEDFFDLAGEEAIALAMLELQECNARGTSIVKKYVKQRQLSKLTKDIAQHIKLPTPAEEEVPVEGDIAPAVTEKDFSTPAEDEATLEGSLNNLWPESLWVA
jgi:hypothetical protein